MSRKESLKRRLQRLQKMRDEIKAKHKGNELNYTYWGGYNLGYLEGTITAIENIIDEFETFKEKEVTNEN